MSDQSEFSIIQQYFEQLTSQREDVELGIGDDCALLRCPEDHVTAVSIDTLVENIHFFADVDPVTLGHKSLAVSLSDLAAMGATPAWFTLALTLPKVDEKWLKGFSTGLADIAKQHNIQLVGGDTTRGPLTISIQAHGHVKAHKAIKRSGAQAGDLIYVTGTLGDAGAALQLRLNQWHDDNLSRQDQQYLQQRLEMPTPRVEQGQLLSGIASAAIDISDGLLADLGHITRQSGVGARLDLAKLPISKALGKVNRTMAESLALESGDDYELCFTVPPHYFSELGARLADQCTQIGVITEQAGLSYIDENHGFLDLNISKAGYDHFK